VYLFSVENFNRPKSEVEQLMQLIKAKVEMLDRYGASIRLLGQREMIPDDVLQVMDNVVARTKHNKKFG
jgi:ditrans,polycis-polyprenyl diphosphate synthase